MLIFVVPNAYLGLEFQTNMFIVNLAISDSGIMLTQGPLMFINAFSSKYWMWGSFVCRLYGCLGGIFGMHQDHVSFSVIK